MNVSRLKKNREVQHSQLVEMYRMVINKLWGKIQSIDASAGVSGPKNYIYEVPNFLVGEPQYDREVAFELIKRKLLRGGFQIQSLEANNTYFIYIDWSSIDSEKIRRRKSRR